MNAEKFEQLLGFGEKDFIDFKSEIYFTNPAKDKDKARAEFVNSIWVSRSFHFQGIGGHQYAVIPAGRA